MRRVNRRKVDTFNLFLHIHRYLQMENENPKSLGPKDYMVHTFSQKE